MARFLAVEMADKLNVDWWFDMWNWEFSVLEMENSSTLLKARAIEKYERIDMHQTLYVPNYIVDDDDPQSATEMIKIRCEFRFTICLFETHVWTYDSNRYGRI